MKIILADNLNRDYYSETLIGENVEETNAHRIVAMLNKRLGENAEDYYKVEDDNYELKVNELD
jgi:hypothetical protein